MSEWTKERTDSLLAWVGPFVKGCLEDRGRFLPQVVLFSDEQHTVILMDDSFEEWQVPAIGAIKVFCQQQKPDALVFLSEVWMVAQKDETITRETAKGKSYKELTGYDSLADHPARIECIVALIHTIGDDRILRKAEIKRDKAGKPTINPDDFLVDLYDNRSGELEGRWFDCLR